MGRYIVYGLKDPRDGSIFYVGKSCRGMDRAKRHLSKWHQQVDCNTDKLRRIAKILCAGLQPQVVVLSKHRNPKELTHAETKIIRAWSKTGSLVNRLNNRRR